MKQVMEIQDPRETKKNHKTRNQASLLSTQKNEAASGKETVLLCMNGIKYSRIKKPSKTSRPLTPFHTEFVLPLVQTNKFITK